MMLCVYSNSMIYVYVCLYFCKCILYIYLFIYLISSIGRVVGRSVPLTNIWRELDMQISRELLKGQIKIKQIKKWYLFYIFILLHCANESQHDQQHDFVQVCKRFSKYAYKTEATVAKICLWNIVLWVQMNTQNC